MEGTQWCSSACRGVQESFLYDESMRQRATKEDQASLCICVRCLYNNWNHLSYSQDWTFTPSRASWHSLLTPCMCVFWRKKWWKETHKWFGICSNVSSFWLFYTFLPTWWLTFLPSHCKLNISYFKKLLRGHLTMMHFHMVFLFSLLKVLTVWTAIFSLPVIQLLCGTSFPSLVYFMALSDAVPSTPLLTSLLVIPAVKHHWTAVTYTSEKKHF